VAALPSFPTLEEFFGLLFDGKHDLTFPSLPLERAGMGSPCPSANLLFSPLFGRVRRSTTKASFLFFLSFSENGRVI